MNQRRYKHLFGPVNSRRLGRSLGVDLVGHKICPIDCIYCEVGATTRKTLQRAEYEPTEEILAELRDKLAQDVPIDYITLSGAGEPTLHSRLGEIIDAIKAMTSIPVAVLTNGNLLFDPQVRRELLGADLVLPSLDAGDEATYLRMNRPCPEATFARLVEGLRAFRKDYPGQIRLEVLLVAGVNDSPEQVRKIRVLIDQIQPDLVDVNTVTRPPTESDARAVPPAKLAKLAAILGEKANVIASAPSAAPAAARVDAQTLLDLLRRRPCTLDDMADGLASNVIVIIPLIGRLLEEGKVHLVAQDGKEYFVAG